MRVRDLLVVGPPDSVSALLAHRLGSDPETATCRRADAPAPAAGAGSYAELLAGAVGHATAGAAVIGAGTGGAAAAGGAASLADARRGLTVVYRPPRLGGGARAGLPDLADAASLLAACLACPPAHLVLVSSAAALEPHHQNPGLVVEPARPARVGNPVARAWLELEERALALAERPASVPLTVLRPAAVAARDGGDYLSRLLRARLALPLAGHDPSVQLLAPEDLAQAVLLAVRAGGPAAERDGRRVRTYHVAPGGAVPLRAALRLAGIRWLPLGRSLQRLARSVAAPLGWAVPIEQLDYLRYSVTVGNRSIQEELGFAPASGSAAAVVEGLASRPEAARQVARKVRAAQAARAEQDARTTQAAQPGEPAKTARTGEPAAAPAGQVATAPDGPASAAAWPEFDDYGMDRDYIAAFGRTLFHFLHRYYWRIEVCGLEHVPRSGRAMLVGVHRGFQPWDGVMALHTLVRGVGRYPRFLIHPALVKFPFLADYMTKLGGIIACQENADWVFEREELVGMFPEGIQGAFTMYRDAYRLGKFGRDEFVKMALRNRAPLVPFVTAGSAEIYPILGKLEWRWFKRLTEWPFLPLTPTFPLPGLPLPSKWHTQFLEPMPIQRRYGPEAAQDAAAVREISQEVRGRMQEALERLRRRRRSIFYGSIFTGEDEEEGLDTDTDAAGAASGGQGGAGAELAGTGRPPRGGAG
jgi:1-acyl-sn-glycerol-3-phosphate acyltransferase/nucleoside-diphosphate-sugar epimerase